MSVGSLAAGSVAAVRERDALRRHARHLRDRRLFLVVDPGLAALGAATRRRLMEDGATVAFDASGDDHAVLAAQANAFGADVCVAVVTGTEPGARCVYFANQTFRSEGGLSPRARDHRSVCARCSPASTIRPAGPTGSCARPAWPRSCASSSRVTSRPARRRLMSRGPELADALTVGLRLGIEQPVDVAP